MKTKKKQLLLHVYDEVADEGDLRELMAEEENRKEYEALSGTRVLLERHQGRHRPTAEALDRIMDEARGQTRAASIAPRPAVPHMRLVFRALAVAAVLVVGLAAGVFLLGGEQAAEKAPVLASEEVPLEWDTGDDIRALHHRLSTIQGASDLSWDTPPVPLESLPTQIRTPEFIPANSN